MVPVHTPWHPQQAGVRYGKKVIERDTKDSRDELLSYVQILNETDHQQPMKEVNVHAILPCWAEPRRKDHSSAITSRFQQCHPERFVPPYN